MMKVRIEGQEYAAETAVELIHQIKGLHWHAGKETTAEEYIAMQKETYRKLTGRRMRLPWKDTETRAAEMFRQIAQTGALEFEEGGNDHDR